MKFLARIGQTKTIAVNYRLGTLTETETIAVYPDNSGDCAAERIERGWRVMGFHLIGDQIILVKNNTACVVGEDGDTYIIFAALGTYFGGCALDIVLIKSVFDFIDRRGKNRVLTMLRPCLR